eukprot:TRINITY_DN4227_c0_g3_i1.p2 TRINITY_DN4227_c0_g3~~TRINITY_DN4227_c0_g3_i1.p2  ORF type:complete len:129 (-),score=1.94 TRINITY_DN4227_c0_g3_i1:128-514(-)
MVLMPLSLTRSAPCSACSLSRQSKLRSHHTAKTRYGRGTPFRNHRSRLCHNGVICRQKLLVANKPNMHRLNILQNLKADSTATAEHRSLRAAARKEASTYRYHIHLDGSGLARTVSLFTTKLTISFCR